MIKKEFKLHLEIYNLFNFYYTLVDNYLSVMS